MTNNKFRDYKVFPSLDHRQENYPYPIHDWKDNDLYIKARSSKEWAWEFFRRNGKYQYDQDRYINKGHFPEFDIEYSELMTLESLQGVTQSARHLGFILNEFQALENNIFTYYSHRMVKLGDGETVPLKDAIWKKHGIFPQSNTLLHDPKLDLPEHNFFHADHSIFIAEYLENKPLHKQFSVGCCSKEDIIFRLNADKPIEKQLALVKKRLLNKRSRLGIPSPNKSPRKVSDDIYTVNIRMLDALASYGLLTTSKITNEIAIEIVNEIKPLHPKEKSSHLTRLNEWIDRTYPIVEHGYLYLLEK